MNRRGFLAAMLAAGVAPAVVRAQSLMKLVPLSDSGIVGLEWAEIDLGIATPMTLTEIINKTLRERAPEIAATIQRQNALLRVIDYRMGPH